MYITDKKETFKKKLYSSTVLLCLLYNISTVNGSDMVVYSAKKQQNYDHLLVNTIPQKISKNHILSQDVDPQLLCFIASSFYEKKYKMPKHILHSISIVESGKLNREYKIPLAWPWVVGIDGKGRFFNTYSEAAKFLRQAVDAGDNVDIGCHQINWKHHKHHFRKPEELLHPKHNAAYAAYFLTQHFNETKSWDKAISYYHSRTPELGSIYLKKVHTIWNDIRGVNNKHYNEYVRVKKSELRDNRVETPLYYKKIESNKTDAIHNLVKQDKDLKKRNFKYRKKNQNDMVVFSEKVDLPTNDTSKQW